MFWLRLYQLRSAVKFCRFGGSLELALYECSKDNGAGCNIIKVLNSLLISKDVLCFAADV